MDLVCHVLSQDYGIKKSFDIMDEKALMVRHHPAKFGNHGDCGTGNIMLLVVKE